MGFLRYLDWVDDLSGNAKIGLLVGVCVAWYFFLFGTVWHVAG